MVQLRSSVSDGRNAHASSPLILPEGENVVLLLGAPRSGTTWLAKILDSHPDVLYRHEPDTVLRNDELPHLCSRDDAGSHRDEARNYLGALFNVRVLKSVGSRPSFRKNYRGPLRSRLRTALINGLLAMDTAWRGQKW